MKKAEIRSLQCSVYLQQQQLSKVWVVLQIQNALTCFTLEQIDLFTFCSVVLVCLRCGLVIPYKLTSRVELSFSMNSPSKRIKLDDSGAYNVPFIE